MGMINLRLERKLAAADIAISNALADEDIRGALSRFAYKPERLKKGLGLYNTASTLYQERDQAFKALDAWMRDFWEICRLALADTPKKSQN